MTTHEPPKFSKIVGEEPRASFASEWEQYWYHIGLEEGFMAGKALGYREAVEESYPELTAVA